MPELSVIVPVLNGEGTIADTLDSIDRSIDHFRATGGAGSAAEVIVVDDGSEDYTLAKVLARARDRDHYRVLHRDERSSPAHARNCGVAAAQGGIILFLDADDQYLEDHIRACSDALGDVSVQFVKTGVRLSDPVHPDWAARIAHSLVINVAIRKSCHERIGGFSDYQLVRRDPDGYSDWDVGIFFMIEDIFYNDLLKSTFRCRRLDRETALYRRRPGNSFDQQYAKFCASPANWAEQYSREKKLRVQMAQLITNFHKEALRQDDPRPRSG